MQKLEALLFDFAFIGYLAATILYLVYVRSRDDRHSGRGHRILIASAAVHTVSLGLGLWVEAHRPGHVAFGFWSNCVRKPVAVLPAYRRGVPGRANPGAAGDSRGVRFALGGGLDGRGLAQAFLASRCPFASVEDLRSIS
ncbi:MAG: hypothetical protein IPJ35_11295 [Elusimicrobia bacterium]|nr:hypothetical protein [Elusimicrobiota bacterium]